LSHQDLSQLTAAGEEIERASFEFIDRMVQVSHLSQEEWEVARRVIHTTGDFEFKDLLRFATHATSAGVAAIEAGAHIITDVTMIKAGLSPGRLNHFNLKVHTPLSDPAVLAAARELGTTRSRIAMHHAAQQGLLDGSIIAIGNAPTALLSVCDLIKSGAVRPALVIGVPVGFIAAAESKERLCQMTEVPFISVSGYKGGSTIAVAILHALMKIAGRRTP
jgi:precorrin-8X/cobalt-precorrin-8 methylmutase